VANISLQKNVFLFLCLPLLSGCSAMSFLGDSFHQPKHSLKLMSDADVTPIGEPTQKKKKGDVFEITDAAVLIESKDRMTILVLPNSEDLSHEIILDPKPLFPNENSVGNEGSGYSSRFANSFNTIMKGVSSVQSSLAHQDAETALAKVTKLQSQFPDVSYLQFLKVSCLLAGGETEKAESLLKSALDEHPDDEAGQALAEELFGKRYEPSKERKPAGHEKSEHD
jgi:hypothetical protein